MICIKNESLPSLLTLTCLEALKQKQDIDVPDDINLKYKILKNFYKNSVRIDFDHQDIYDTKWITEMKLYEIKENENSWIFHYCPMDFGLLKFRKDKFSIISRVEVSLFDEKSYIYDDDELLDKTNIPYEKMNETFIKNVDYDGVKTNFVITFGEDGYFGDKGYFQNETYRHVKDIVIIVWKYDRSEIEYYIDDTIYKTIKKQMDVMCKKYENVKWWCIGKIMRRSWNSNKYHPYIRGYLRSQLRIELTNLKNHMKTEMLSWVYAHFKNGEENEGMFEDFTKSDLYSAWEFYKVLKPKYMKKEIENAVMWMTVKIDFDLGENDG